MKENFRPNHKLVSNSKIFEKSEKNNFLPHKRHVPVRKIQILNLMRLNYKVDRPTNVSWILFCFTIDKFVMCE